MCEFKCEGREKEIYVERLFASAASKYDLLNAVISLGRHRSWRKYAVSQAGIESGARALDVACGTADFAMELLRRIGPDGLAVGVDFCLPMLRLGAEKAGRSEATQLQLLAANAERLPFPDNSFDCATIGFALRNVASVRRTLAEMTRVVRRGGRVVSLEIIGPEFRPAMPFWRLYFFRIMPAIASLLGGQKEAYHYLPRSVERFHRRQELKEEMELCGLMDVQVRSLALGTVCLHVGTKR